MNQGFKAFTKSNPKKAEELGMTNSTSNFIIPKLRRANTNATTSTKYANSDGEVSGRTYNYSECPNNELIWYSDRSP